MKVKNMTNKNGRAVPNQFIITDERLNGRGETNTMRYFQSYESIIVEIENGPSISETRLDRDTWDYSKTTSRYRNQFLGETKKETQAKIDSGEYVLVDLN